MDLRRTNYKIVLVLIPTLSIVLHWHIFDRDLVGIHVWRQTETQTLVNNLSEGLGSITDPLYNDIGKDGVRMEFPVMQWTFAQFQKAFGDSIAVSRILTFIIGLLSVFGMFRLADTVFRNKFAALICAWAFNWSPVFFYYTVNPLPDNFALCAAIWAAVFFFKYTRSGSTAAVIASATLLGFATLAKLPYILYGTFVLGWLFVSVRHKERLPVKAILIYAIAQIPAAIWYINAIPTWRGNGVLKGMADVQEKPSEILNILIGNLTSILPELLLNYGSILFFIAGFYFMFRNKAHRDKLFPVFLIWSAFILAYFFYEANMIGLIHDYYLFPFLPLIFLIVAYGAGGLVSLQKKGLNYFVLLCLIILPLTAFLRINDRWRTDDPGFNPVYYQHKNELRELIPQDAKVIVGNDDSHFILLYYLNKRGWAFDHDWMNGERMTEFVSKGAIYLFTDSPVDNNEDVKPFLDEKIFERGTLRVYKLKAVN